MADAHEESSEDSSDSTSSNNFSIYTETSSSEEDLQNVEEPGTSTSSATTHNSRTGKSKSSPKQPTVKRSKRQQSFFAGKAYLKINSLVKTPLHEFMAVARSGLWAPGLGAFVSILTTPALLESSSKDKVKTESLIVGDVKYLLRDALHSKSKRYF